jgi:hypothetical protein
LALDRGRHVRTPEAYLALARRHFRDAKATILHDLIAIPIPTASSRRAARSRVVYRRSGRER